ncbi:snoRNP complex protein nop56 [Bachmanniomyces sp. S44760]|nr:snoRNP complex protein nop56 [Bachmanniomyces sp. S44760]
MAAPDSLKRTAGEAKLEQVIHDEAIPSIESSSRTTSVDTQIKGQAVTTSLTHIGSRAGSLANGVCVTPVPSSPQPSAGSASKAEHNPAKRRKLTAAEKETARVEKEARELERALEKSRKADEKRVKDEEREVKRKAKEAEKQVKDEEKRKKEEERKAKEEEKSKKEKGHPAVI